MEEVKIGTPEQPVQGEVRINEKSDFPLAVRLVHNGQEQPWPQVDFSLKAAIEGSFKEFRASRVGGVFTHCRVDDDRLLVFFDNHGLKNGLVRVEVTFNYPDSNYTTDGLRQETFSATSNIRLVKDSGDALSLKLPEPKIVEKVVEKIVEKPVEKIVIKEVMKPDPMPQITEQKNFGVDGGNMYASFVVANNVNFKSVPAGYKFPEYEKIYIRIGNNAVDKFLAFIQRIPFMNNRRFHIDCGKNNTNNVAKELHKVLPINPDVANQIAFINFTDDIDDEDLMDIYTNKGYILDANIPV